jgi:hypothetical protein
MKTCETCEVTLSRLASTGAWVRRLALLTFALLGPFAIPMQGYQGPQDEPFTVNIADADGIAMPDVDVVLMRGNFSLE